MAMILWTTKKDETFSGHFFTSTLAAQQFAVDRDELMTSMIFISEAEVDCGGSFEIGQWFIKVLDSSRREIEMIDDEGTICNQWIIR